SDVCSSDLTSHSARQSLPRQWAGRGPAGSLSAPGERVPASTKKYRAAGQGRLCPLPEGLLRAVPLLLDLLITCFAPCSARGRSVFPCLRSAAPRAALHFI